MLQGLRKVGQGLVGKIIITVLFGILIVSFAIWGIGDIFRGGQATWVARVGDTEISAEQYRTTFNNQLQRLNRQVRGRITTEQARAYGLDRQVLSQLVNEAVLDERARQLGLSISDELVARWIQEQPFFQDQSGRFSRVLFENVLRESGLGEAGFVREQRSAIARTQVVEAMTGALPVPAAAREAFHRYATERRTADYLTLGPAAAGEIPAPTAEQLQSFYAERKGTFRAPEYRALNVVVLDAAALAKPEAIPEAEVRRRYDEQKERFGAPERRSVQQIVFPSREEAEAALARIKEGAPFETVASERGVPAQDLELGTFAKSEMLDPTVADAAFALQPNEVSAPVQGRFGTVLLRVTNVQPASVRPLEEVAGEIRKDLAEERARDEIDRVHDEIEDLRASARPLAEVAQEKNLKLLQIPAVDQTGRDKAGNPVPNLPEAQTLLPAAFASDIGVDNEPLHTREGSYIWYDVTGIEPAREKTLDEVRAEVERQWHANEVAERLTAKARQIVERLDKGEPLRAVAAELGVEAKAAADLARRAPKDELSADAVTRIFATPVGQAGTAPNGPEGRAVFKVTGASVPPLLTTTQEAEQLENRVREGMADTLLAEYIAQAQTEIPVRINEHLLQTALGGV